MNESTDTTIRPMRPEEIEAAIAWAAEEGWNPGKHDGACFFAADPQGFFVAEEKGQLVGCVSAVAYDDRVGFAGFFMVCPAHRGRGIGRRLGETVFRRLGGRLIGLDGVVAQQNNYRRAGFRMAHRNVRFQTSGAAGSQAGLTDLARADFADLVAYDARHFLAPRPRFLARWLVQPEGAALAIVESGHLRGYGVLRACRIGYKIGPLFAEDGDAAEGLLAGLLAKAGNEPVFLDVPEANPAALSLVERHGMTRVFETARMYNGEAPPLPLASIFGITSYELG